MIMKCLLLDARYFSSKPKEDGKSVALAEMMLLDLSSKKIIRQIIERSKFQAFFPMDLGLAIDEVQEVTLEQSGFNSVISEVATGKERVEFVIKKA